MPSTDRRVCYPTSQKLPQPPSTEVTPQVQKLAQRPFPEGTAVFKSPRNEKFRKGLSLMKLDFFYSGVRLGRISRILCLAN